jgi:cyclopropane fatty-acyl-phospholipid synthase-like methyltransferase
MSLLRRLKFNLWYYQKPPWDHGISPPELMDFIHAHPPGRALDLGCGTGTNVITLAQNGWEAVGVDFAPRAIQLAQRKIKKAGVKAEVRVGDVTQLEGVQGPFNLILDMGCYHNLTARGRKAYLLQAESLLVDGGSLLLYTFIVPDSSDGELGTSEAEIERMCQTLPLAWRKDGSERGLRPSAWLRFEKGKG